MVIMTLVDYYASASMIDATVTLTIARLTSKFDALIFAPFPQSLLVVEVWSHSVDKYQRYRANKANKKFELMLTRCAQAYNSSGLVV